MNLLVGGLALGAIYGLVAIGVVLIARTTGVVNFAQGDLVTAGAYGYVLTSVATASPLLRLAGAVAGGMLLGVGLYFVTAHVLRKSSRIGVVIGTFGVSIVAEALLRHRFSDNPKAADAWLFGERTVAFGGTIVPANSLVMIAAAVLIGIALHAWLRFTLSGKAMESVAEDPRKAGLTGIPVARNLLISWLLGGTIAAVGGMLIAPITGVYPTMGAELLLAAFVAALIGGFSSVIGALLGGLSLGVLQTYAIVIVGGTLRELIVFSAVLLILLLRPTGLIRGISQRRF
jgi:branched-chain amino acid transport system permease protein